MASDIFHWFGNDLNVSATGDLLTVGDVTKGNQRVLRRLLTSPDDLVFHPEYGAGLPLYIGEPTDIATIEAIIRYQSVLESQIARDPQAQVIVNPIFAGVHARIIYTDADSGNPTSLSFDINE
jgi:hypothetical protein